jgi:DNA-binding MurR/RpiR family transcriptional regulator
MAFMAQPRSQVAGPRSQVFGPPENPVAALESGFADLPPKQRRAAKFILRDESAVAFLSANELADRVGVDPATIVRLSQRLGYRGYPHLQEAVRRQIPRYQSFVDKLEQSRPDVPPVSALDRSLEQDRENLSRARESVDPAAFETLVAALLEARRTVLVGGGVARPVVIFLSSSLRMMGFDVRDTTAGSTTLAQELALLEEGDLLLAIGFYRYLRETVEAACAARRQGVRVAAVTDSAVSPLVAMSDLALCVPVDSTSHRISLVGSMAVANALIAALAARARDRVTGVLRRVNDEYNRARLVVYEE